MKRIEIFLAVDHGVGVCVCVKYHTPSGICFNWKSNDRIFSGIRCSLNIFLRDSKAKSIPIAPLASTNVQVCVLGFV